MIGRIFGKILYWFNFFTFPPQRVVNSSQKEKEFFVRCAQQASSSPLA
jgi:hypothetical protein